MGTRWAVRYESKVRASSVQDYEIAVDSVILPAADWRSSASCRLVVLINLRRRSPDRQCDQCARHTTEEQADAIKLEWHCAALLFLEARIVGRDAVRQLPRLAKRESGPLRIEIRMLAPEPDSCRSFDSHAFLVSLATRLRIVLIDNCPLVERCAQQAPICCPVGLENRRTQETPKRERGCAVALHGDILSVVRLDRQTFRSRPLDQPPGRNGANVYVVHQPPDSVNRPNVCRRAPSVTAVSAGSVEVDRRD